jgi:hypothetical protein
LDPLEFRELREFRDLQELVEQLVRQEQRVPLDPPEHRALLELLDQLERRAFQELLGLLGLKEVPVSLELP